VKKLMILALICTIQTTHAREFGAPIGESVAPCAKWSIWYHCQDVYSSHLQAVNVGSICQTQNGGDAFHITSHNSSDPGQPSKHYWAVWWSRCLQRDIGGIAPPDTGFGYAVATELNELFEPNVAVSEFTGQPDGTIRIYVADPIDETMYESVWSPDGALQDIHPIDADSDPLFHETIGEHGLAFVLLGSVDSDGGE